MLAGTTASAYSDIEQPARNWLGVCVCFFLVGCGKDRVLLVFNYFNFLCSVLVGVRDTMQGRLELKNTITGKLSNFQAFMYDCKGGRERLLIFYKS